MESAQGQTKKSDTSSAVHGTESKEENCGGIQWSGNAQHGCKCDETLSLHHAETPRA